MEQRLFYAIALLASGCVVDFPGYAGGADGGPEADATPAPATTDPTADAGTDEPTPDAAREPEGCVPGTCDADGDGVAPPRDCDDGNRRIYPTATEICGDGVDSDCDGDPDGNCLDLDRDRDGVRAALPDEDLEGLDCDDNDPDIRPGAPELCNGHDDDCDQRSDEDLHLGETCVAGTGGCQRPGLLLCNEEGRIECDAVAGQPDDEVRGNGVDDDCDTVVDEVPCDDGLTGPDGHCYVLAPLTATWHLARDGCAAYLGHLVTIGSAEENAFVLENFRRDIDRNLWIGLTDDRDEERWRWVTDEPFVPAQARWAPGEPNDSGNEDCANMYGNGLWNDEICWSNLNFVCEWE